MNDQYFGLIPPSFTGEAGMKINKEAKMKAKEELENPPKYEKLQVSSPA